jgi:hypothetical protein
MSLSSLKLHNAMWPGLVGKGDGEGEESPFSLERMLELTANADVIVFCFIPTLTPKPVMMI